MQVGRNWYSSMDFLNLVVTNLQYNGYLSIYILSIDPCTCCISIGKEKEIIIKIVTLVLSVHPIRQSQVLTKMK